MTYINKLIFILNIYIAFVYYIQNDNEYAISDLNRSK